MSQDLDSSISVLRQDMHATITSDPTRLPYVRLPMNGAGNRPYQEYYNQSKCRTGSEHWSDNGDLVPGLRLIVKSVHSLQISSIRRLRRFSRDIQCPRQSKATSLAILVHVHDGHGETRQELGSARVSWPCLPISSPIRSMSSISSAH